jgi:hypothetical protein
VGNFIAMDFDFIDKSEQIAQIVFFWNDLNLVETEFATILLEGNALDFVARSEN